MVKIVQNLVPESKYNIKCPYYMEPIGITVHNTANDASAMNEISYMIRNDNETSFHYAVDDIQAVQGLPLDRNGWHASDGNGTGNRKTIAIEICYSKSGGYRFDKAEENAAELIAMLLEKYGWDISVVKRHYDYAPNKKYCPHRTMDKGWDRFLDMVKSKLHKDVELDYEEIEKKSVVLNKDTNLWNLNFSSWEDATSVKEFSKGTQIDNIVAIATHPLGSKYYITEYSYKNGIANGFNTADCDDIVEKPNNGDSEPINEDSPILPIEPKNDDNKENNQDTSYYDDKEKRNALLWIIQVIIDFLKKIFK